MRESTDEKKIVDNCMGEQREFLAMLTKVLNSLNRIDEIDSRLSKEVADLKTTQSTMMISLKPVLDAFTKGMSLKARMGNIAIIYIFLSFIFSKMPQEIKFSWLKYIFLLFS